MDDLHREFATAGEAVVEVEFGGQATVFLLDCINYTKYRGGVPFAYEGGLYRRSPVRLNIPRAGQWHVVVEPKVSVRVIPWA